MKSMRKKEIKELRQKTGEELSKLVRATEMDLVKLLTEMRAGKLKNVSQIAKKRVSLAVIKTIINEGAQKI